MIAKEAVEFTPTGRFITTAGGCAAGIASGTSRLIRADVYSGVATALLIIPLVRFGASKPSSLGLVVVNVKIAAFTDDD